MIRHLSISILSLFFVAVLYAQPAERRITRSEYIEKYKDDAIQEMHHSGVPASITLAQGILESGDGNSPLALYANNHFGIKCHTSWKGETFVMDDDEKNECFRKYNSAYESFKDHSEFLTSRSRYASLFELKITDYKGWATGLKAAGYATNPKYADLLIALIEKHELNQYDNYAKVPSKQLAKNKTSSILAENQSKRVIKLRNNVKYTFASSEDDVNSIAKDFNLNVWQILKYNDLNKSDKLTTGEIIYLQPKRNKAAEEYHTVKNGESMRDIAQMHGIKLKQLYKKNNMFVGTYPQVGQKLSLRKKLKE
jgi:LysM repeat protein